jgi:hypothetical protein
MVPAATVLLASTYHMLVHNTVAGHGLHDTRMLRHHTLDRATTSCQHERRAKVHRLQYSKAVLFIRFAPLNWCWSGSCSTSGAASAQLLQIKVARAAVVYTSCIYAGAICLRPQVCNGVRGAQLIAVLRALAILTRFRVRAAGSIEQTRTYLGLLNGKRP